MVTARREARADWADLDSRVNTIALVLDPVQIEELFAGSCRVTGHYRSSHQKFRDSLFAQPN